MCPFHLSRQRSEETSAIEEAFRARGYMVHACKRGALPSRQWLQDLEEQPDEEYRIAVFLNSEALGRWFLTGDDDNEWHANMLNSWGIRMMVRSTQLAVIKVDMSKLVGHAGRIDALLDRLETKLQKRWLLDQSLIPVLLRLPNDVELRTNIPIHREDAEQLATGLSANTFAHILERCAAARPPFPTPVWLQPSPELQVHLLSRAAHRVPHGPHGELRLQRLRRTVRLVGLCPERRR